MTIILTDKDLNKKVEGEPNLYGDFKSHFTTQMINSATNIFYIGDEGLIPLKVRKENAFEALFNLIKSIL